MNPQTLSFQPSPSESPEATIYTDPDDVVSDPRLTTAQKRAVLASWISDARAVENAPRLRRLDSGAIVEFDAIRRSLISLETSGWPRERPAASHRRPGAMSRWGRVGSPDSSNDDDDDPPPAPAGAAVPLRLRFVPAYGARPERPWGAASRARMFTARPQSPAMVRRQEKLRRGRAKAAS